VAEESGLFGQSKEFGNQQQILCFSVLKTKISRYAQMLKIRRNCLEIACSTFEFVTAWAGCVLQLRFLEIYPPPSTHTHTNIYIYVYVYICLFQRESDHCSWRGPGPPATAHKSSIYPSIPAIYCPMMNIYLSINATYCIGRMYPAVDIRVQHAMP
jgi:hypothetical protein